MGSRRVFQRFIMMMVASVVLTGCDIASNVERTAERAGVNLDFDQNRKNKRKAQSDEEPAEDAPIPYEITKREAKRILKRHLEEVNEARKRAGRQPVVLSEELTSAAERHARDMRAQKRAWHFGRDGSSPVERIIRSGYPGTPLGENVAESFENDSEILSAWLRDDNSRLSILNREAKAIGIGWAQDSDLKIWWVQTVGGDPVELPPEEEEPRRKRLFFNRNASTSSP